MEKVKSIESFLVKGRGTVFVIKSPVISERTIESIKCALTGKIEIDGVEYTPKGLDCRMPGTKISVGEVICLLV